MSIRGPHGVPSTRVLAACLLSVCATPAVAGVYTVSSPNPTSSQEVKAEIKLDDQTLVDKYTLPKLEYKTPLANNLDLGIEASRKSVHPQDGPVSSGYGGFEMKSKWRVYRSGHFGLAVEAKLKLPARHGPHALRGANKLELPFMIGWQRGPWTFGSEVGYKHKFEPGGDSAYAGVLVKRQVTPSLKVGAEYVADSPETNIHGLSRIVNVGVEWHLGNHFKLEAGAGRTLHRVKPGSSRTYVLELEKKW